jgi:hypothetical protein
LFRELAEVIGVPKTWFGAFDDVTVLCQVSLDGSYSRPDPKARRFFAYAGLFGFDGAWRLLAPEWQKVLEDHGLKYFRTNEHKVFRNEFVEAISNAGLQAVGAVADEARLDDRHDSKRKRGVFERVVRQLLGAAPSHVNFALICDREQDLAKEVASWLDRLKLNEPVTYARVTGICYMNSRSVLQVQAADLAAGLFREQAEREASDEGASVNPLLAKLMGKGRFAAERILKSEFFQE